MTGFDKTITIYNKRYDKPTRMTLWLKTVIEGVSWAGCQRVTTGDGLTSNDGYNVRIPKDKMPNGYLLSDKYVALEDPTGYWTAQNGDVVLLGVGPDVTKGASEITQQFTDCFIVIAVHSDNLERFLPHLRLDGK